MEEPGSTLLALEEGEGWSFAEGRSDQLLTRFEALVADPNRTVLEKGTWLVALTRLVLRWSQDLIASLDHAENEHAALPDPRPSPRVLGQACEEARALAAWLDTRPILGRDVFVASTPSAQPHAETSLAAFLVASLVAFEGRAGSAAELPVWRIMPLDFPDLALAREQLLRLLEKAARVPLASVTETLERLPEGKNRHSGHLHRRATLAGSFLASLELAKQGEAVLTQDGLFAEVFIERVNTSELRDSNPLALVATRKANH